MIAKMPLGGAYRDYIACLNRRELETLDRHVREDVTHNGRPLGVAGYRQMLEKDFADIPDLHFRIELLVVDPPYVSSRLRFDCTPKGRFLDLDIDGSRVSFAENVFYEYADGRIAHVWSIIDKPAIEAQLSALRGAGGAAPGRDPA